VSPDYLVSSAGRVWSRRRYGGKLLNAHPNHDGYLKVSLGDKKFLVHRLVAVAFIGRAPEGKPTVNHKDGVKTNNDPANLEWASRKDQARHRDHLGLRAPDFAQGAKNGKARLTEGDVLSIRKRHSEGEPIKDLANEFGVSYQTGTDICARRTWKHI